jgi:bifunctional DNase/RNase
MGRMVEVVIDSVRVSLTNTQRIVVLRDSATDRYLPIWIGAYEAEAITIALQEVEVARPQTHDLLKLVLNALGAHLVRVEVVAMREDVFYGNLVVEDITGHVRNVDCRPSDAIALAARLRVPILVSRDVLDSAGITPEEEAPADEAASPSESTPPATPATDDKIHVDRLSVFEDFLSGINLDENPPSDTPDENNPPDEDDHPKKRP